MREYFSELANTILEVCEGAKKVYYMANPGNWGDGLIREGAIRFFEDYNIRYEEIEGSKLIDLLNKDCVLIYGGGGAWCTHWNSAPKIVAAVAPYLKNIIVLPSTYQLYSNVANVIYFARDRYESMEVMPHARFCHDMAFYLKPEAVSPDKINGYFFRTDEESTGLHEMPESNFDLSMCGTHLSDSKAFFDNIAQYQKIYTDRLHIAIAGCLLGRVVNFFPNDYFKNRALYKSSIKDIFPDVFFYEEFQQNRPI